MHISLRKETNILYTLGQHFSQNIKLVNTHQALCISGNHFGLIGQNFFLNVQCCTIPLSLKEKKIWSNILNTFPIIKQHNLFVLFHNRKEEEKTTCTLESESLVQCVKNQESQAAMRGTEKHSSNCFYCQTRQLSFEALNKMYI